MLPLDPGRMSKSVREMVLMGCTYKIVPTGGCSAMDPLMLKLGIGNRWKKGAKIRERESTLGALGKLLFIGET